MAREIVGQVIITIPIEAETGNDVSSESPGSIRSRGPSRAYDRGWDNVFGKTSRANKSDNRAN